MLAVLVNPHARGTARDPTLPARLAAIAGEHEVHTTSAETLPALIADLARREVSIVALCGGDGTGQAVLTELATAYRELPKIALLRGGTVNTIARNLGVRGSPEILLQKLVDRLRDRAPLPTTRQSTISVDGRLGFLFAAALGARFLAEYYAHPSPGPAHAAWLAARVSASALFGGRMAQRLFAPAQVSLCVDDEQHVLAARLLVASTVVDVGIGMRLCPRAPTALDRFALIASALSPSEMARQLPAVRAGRALVGGGHIDRLARAASLRFDREEPYTLDGDLFSATTIALRVGPTIEIVRA